MKILCCRFFSNKNYGRRFGFQLEYDLRNATQWSCGGNYTNQSGILTSPLFPNPYPSAADCVYLISQPNGTCVNISFLTMDISCQEIYSTSDYLEIRDGESKNSPLVEKLCGNGSNIPQFMTSTQNYMRIRLKNKTDICCRLNLGK